MKPALLFVLALSSFAQSQEDFSHRHASSPHSYLTLPSGEAARVVARRFLDSVAGEYKLDSAGIAGVYLASEYSTDHNGITHLYYKQQFQGVDVEGSGWAINVDRDGHVLNAGGTLFPGPAAGLSPPQPNTALQAIRRAMASVNPNRANEYVPFETGRAGAGKVQFARGGFAHDVDGEPVWFAGPGGVLRAGWLFTIASEETGSDLYSVIVDADTNIVARKTNNTFYQSAPVKALVYEKGSPQPNPKPGFPVIGVPPFVSRTEVTLPAAWLDGKQTRGNNIRVGANPAGTLFLDPPLMSETVGGAFSFPLQLGGDAGPPTPYRDAVNTNLFYWLNRAHDMFYEAGFNEAAGNYQTDNFGRGGLGGDPIYGYSQYGSGATTAAATNNAFWTSRRAGVDGVQSMIAMYIGYGRTTAAFSDGSLEPDVIIHEYTHGVSWRLVKGLSTFQGGSMGEAWSDFFGLEFTTPEGAPADGVYPQGGYLFQDFKNGIRTRPYSTDMNVNPLTFASLGHVNWYPEVHADGEIWAQSLWEIRAAFIKQYGEKEGRRRVRLLVLDGLKMTPPSPTFIDARDAILQADRADFGGANQQAIWTAFAKRGLGVLANTRSTSSYHIKPSFDAPSSKALIGFSESSYNVREPVRLIIFDPNQQGSSVSVQFTTSMGDLETVVALRRGSAFVADIPSTYTLNTTKESGSLNVFTADFISAYYNSAAGQISATVPMNYGYATTYVDTDYVFPANEVRLFTPLTNTFGSYDGRFTRVDLAWPFPFFGNNKIGMFVYTNGVIDFDFNANNLCASSSSLLQSASIAPLFGDFRIDGLAQPNENVYLSTTADSLTIRWAGESYDPANPFTFKGTPVNTAVTLYRDGRIDMRYGAGNQGLVKSISYCGSTFPVVAISKGVDTYIDQTSSYDGITTNLDKAKTVRYDPAYGFSTIPAGVWETPTAGDKFKGIISGRGVLYDEGSPLWINAILIDGALAGRAVTGLPRADFCATNKAVACPNVGFTFAVNGDTLGLSPGKHTVQIRFTNTRGAFLDLPAVPREFEWEPADLTTVRGTVETPTEGAEVTGIYQFRGYVVSNSPLFQVDMLIDGVTYGRTSYPAARPDGCGTPAAGTICSGFALTLNTASATPILPNGPHSVTFRARDLAGRFYTFPATPIKITVNNAENKPPVGVLTSHKNGDKLSGVVNVSGYAYDPDGRVTTVSVYVDGLNITNATYGSDRRDICAGLTGVTACPGIGFDARIDSRRFTNGLHSLQIRVTDNSGTTVTAPLDARSGINVFVEN